ncbi:kelch-like protein 10 [Trichomycterus rosablanca]|uniref:kelch-like protein 10 n=1 Tax=Trichomycterus rosablanca TaxID=2290929 RepID=UPI002F3609F8
MSSSPSHTSISRLRSEGKLCDVVLRADGVNFSAHKILLCGSSSYFTSLFTSGWRGTGGAVHTVPGVSPVTMELILSYVYTGRVEVTAQNVERLLEAADRLDVAGVVRLCCRFLEAQLGVHNCVGIRRYAEVYSCGELRDRAHAYVLQNFEEIVRGPTEEFLEMSLAELSSILDQDQLNARREETVFEAAMRWIGHAPDRRSQYVVSLLPKVRLGLMSPEYFLTQVRTCPLLSGYQQCRSIIARTLKVISDIDVTGLTDAALQLPLCRPRLPHSLLFTVGGWSEGSPTDAIEAYDPRAGRWRRVFCSEGAPRAYHGSAYLDGFLYVIGGFDAVDYFNTVRKFHPVARTWHEVAPMHSHRCYVSVALLDGYIYAMGGFDGVTRLDTAERYKPETNQWSLVAPMHEQRSDASAATLNGKIYVCGGFDGNEVLSTAECFDPRSGQWTLIAPMSSRRSGVGVVALNNRLFAVGGFDGVRRLRSVEVYAPQSDSWRNASSMFHQRSNFGVAVLDERLYAVGGFDGRGVTAKSERYDESGDDWFDVQDISVRRSAASCCVVSALPNVTDYTLHRGRPDAS